MTRHTRLIGSNADPFPSSSCCLSFCLREASPKTDALGGTAPEDFELGRVSEDGGAGGLGNEDGGR